MPPEGRQVTRWSAAGRPVIHRAVLQSLEASTPCSEDPKHTLWIDFWVTFCRYHQSERQEKGQLPVYQSATEHCVRSHHRSWMGHPQNGTPTDTLRHHTGHRTGQLGHPGHHRTPLDTPDTPDTSKPDTPDTPDRHTRVCVQNPFGHSGHQTGHSPDTPDTIPGHPPDTLDTRTGHPPDTSRTPPDTRTPRTPRAQPSVVFD